MEERKQIVLRCGNKKGVRGQCAANFCHDVAHAHYTHTLTTADLALKVEDDDETEEEDEDEKDDDDETVAPDAPVGADHAIDLTLEDGTNEDNAIDLDL